MSDLPKLAWSRDVTGKVDNIYSNLTPLDPAMLCFWTAATVTVTNYRCLHQMVA